MTLPNELRLIVDAVLAQITPGQLSDQTIQALSRLMGQNTLIAALDLIDRACVIQWKTAWGQTSYEVRGSNWETYRVFLEDDLCMKPISREEQFVQTTFCSCPAFAYYVLKSEVHAMCKHILAVKLSFRLHKFVERSRTEDIVLAAALAGTALT